MGRKLGLTSLLSRTHDSRVSSSSSPSSWSWLSCNQPRTHSFRSIEGGDAICSMAMVKSFSNGSMEEVVEAESVIHRTRSDRLFFEPCGRTRSILATTDQLVPFTKSIAVEMESGDPYRDFRVSMEEMVVLHCVRDMGRLEEMLGWYLKVNGKKLHGVIVGAFLDMLADLASHESASSSSFSCSSSSTYEIEEAK